MLIATIIVVAILTLLIFTLTIVAFSSFLKSAKQEISSGSKDSELIDERAKENKKSSKVFNCLGWIFSGVVTLALLAASVTAIVYRASGEQLMMGNTTSLVIASNSMDGYYDDDYKIVLEAEKPDAAADQFQIGDLLQFERVSADDQLVKFDVYGYKAKSGKTITHRYIGTTDDGLYIFRGDNTGGRDNYVSREQIVLHYTDVRIPRIGYFIMFSQSGFGLYAFISVIGVYVLGDIYLSKYDKLVKSRLECIDAIEDAKNQPEPQVLQEQTAATAELPQAEPAKQKEPEQKQILAQFDKIVNGKLKHVIIYARAKDVKDKKDGPAEER